MKAFRYFIHLAYRGSNYHGWQYQPNAITVQQTLVHSLSLIMAEETEITGAGRTDTGVHARNFYAHFNADRHFSPVELRQIAYRLNRMLPGDIVIYAIAEVKSDVHARFSAISRTYRYYIVTRKNPFLEGLVWRYEAKLNVGLMLEASELIKQYDDFTCFSKSGTQNTTNLCNVFESHFIQQDELMIYHVKANRFLRNMVRAIVGTLIDVGKGKLDLTGLHSLLQHGCRSDAGESVPACGLFLEEIDYPGDIYIVGE